MENISADLVVYIAGLLTLALIACDALRDLCAPSTGGIDE